MSDATSPTRRTGALGLFILALVLILGVAGSTADSARRAADRECLILSTASNRGEVDPCG
jgi:hypothetical protein